MDIRTMKGKDADGMEEILIRKLVAIKHPNNTFDYSKYRNALSFDTVKREDGWIEYYATFKQKGTLGNRRKGIAIFGTGTLIDSNNNEIVKAYRNGRFYRIFGGYYVNLVTLNYDYLTFPGQDRETEYKQMQIIYAIYDENGSCIDINQSIDVFNKKNILQSLTAIELGEERVFFKNALYNLDDYTLVSKIKKNVIVEGVFIDGLCKVLIPDDNRDFIVAVREKRICQVYTTQEFDLLKEILKLNIKEDDLLWNISKIVQVTDIDPESSTIDEYYPSVEVAIDKYLTITPTLIRNKGGLYQLDPKFNEFFIKELGTGFHSLYWLDSKYYKDVRDDNRYLHIPYEGYKQLYEKLHTANDNRPNFINKVVKVGQCAILGKENLYYGDKETVYDIYRFECRPYGYITTSGDLVYNFDVNNIKW